MYKSILPFLLFSCLSSDSLMAQAGNLDPGFSGNGKLLIILDSVTGSYGSCIAIQPDGKIIVGGCGIKSGNADFAMVRLTANGVLDTAFGGGDGIVNTDLNLSVEHISNIFIQPDGKIVASGKSGTNSPYSFEFATVRYNVDGSLDQTFGNQGVAKSTFGTASQTTMAPQPDGKIIVGGVLDGQLLFTRLNANGMLDFTFGQSGVLVHDLGCSGSVLNGIAVQPDGKILATGYTSFDNMYSDKRHFIIRYLPNGTLDPSFAINGVLHDKFANNASYSESNAIALQQDGKILIGGDADSRWSLARYNPDGSPDPTFDVDGKIFMQIPQRTAIGIKTMTVQPDGTIITTGITYTNNSGGEITTVRYHADGSLDASFGDAGIKIVAISSGGGTDYANAVALQNDGKIVVVGGAENSFHQRGIGVIRFLNNQSAGSGTAPCNYAGNVAILDAGLVNCSRSTISLKLFPNPCSSAFQLEVAGAVIIAGEICDIQGKLIYTLRPMEWRGAVDAGRLTNGIYYLRLVMESGQVNTLKFVKSE